MQKRQKVGLAVVILGTAVLFLTATMHVLMSYPPVSQALEAANLAASVDGGLRALWFMVAWHWIALGIIAVAAAFKGSRFIVLMCAVVCFGDAAATFTVLGLFIGNIVSAVAGTLLLIGAGLLSG
jgi:hypothetical protein